MSKTIVIVALCFAAVCIAVLIFQRKKYDRVMSSLEKILEEAKDGEFVQRKFDESRYSSVENQFAQYLGLSQVSLKNITVEKDKIKTLIADISHQTKTPIANIRLYSELMAETELTEEGEEYLSSLRNQTEKLSFLIDSLVKLSRLETGIVTLSTRKTAVKPMIEKVLTTYGEKAAAKGIEIKAELDDAEEYTAVLDEKWTCEALGNIVDNAIKYTEKGHIIVRVKKYELFLSIEIADTGMGISEEEIPKVFSRFYRGQDVHEREGVGIGLYLAREIVSGEGGYIKVSSERGKGSVFSVFLPVDM